VDDKYTFKLKNDLFTSELAHIDLCIKIINRVANNTITKYGCVYLGLKNKLKPKSRCKIAPTVLLNVVFKLL
jgi:hypothetical protein